jgi:transcriptional regulator with XRE-family HTH domain
MDLRIAERPDPDIMAEIGRRLRALRDATGLNQTEVAERAGLDRTTVSRAEQGDNPTLSTLVRLLRVYGRTDALEAFIPRAEVSPMDIIRRRRSSDERWAVAETDG